MNRIDIQKVERSTLSAHTAFRQYRIQVEVEGPATRNYQPYGKIQLVRWMDRQESFGFLFACLLAMQSEMKTETLETKVNEILDNAEREWEEMQNE